MAKKNQNKIFGLNRNIFFIMVFAVGLFLIIGVSGGGSSDSVRVWEDSATLQDNSLSKSSNGEEYESKEKSAKDVENVEEGQFNSSKNEDDEFSLIDINTNKSFNISDNDLKDIIPFENGHELQYFGLNLSFDSDGFTKEFEYYVVKNNENLFDIYFRIGNQKYSINNLKQLEKDEFDNKLNDIYEQDYEVMYAKTYAGGDDYSNLNNLVSVVGINNNTKGIEIFRTRGYYSQSNDFDSVTGFCVINIKSFFGNPTKVYSTQTGGSGSNSAVDDWNAGKSCIKNPNTNERKTLQLYAINQLNSYSFDSIAVLDSTRTVGFDKYTAVKQDFTDGVGGFNDKYFKLVTGEDLVAIINENENRLNPFTRNRLDASIDTQDLNNKFFANNESYTLGDSIQGVVISNGYVQENDIKNTTKSIVIEQINFNQEEEEGLRFTDLGESTLRGKEIQGYQFGNLIDMNISTQGNAYFIGSSVWSDTIGVIWNLVTFDFSGVSQFWSNSASNVNLVDDFQEGNIAGDKYGFSSGYSNAGSKTITTTQQKPLETLLEYQGNNFWLFYTLETDTQGNKGCMVFDMLDSELNYRLPVTICGEVVAGTNSLAQFKISSSDAVN